MATVIRQEKNRIKQRRYRENLKDFDLHRLTVIVEKDTFNLIRDIARRSKITQGEVIDRMLKGGITMSTATAEDVKTTVNRFLYEDFEQSELAIDVMARMLGFNTKDIMEVEEEGGGDPDPERLKSLKEQQTQLLNEQRLIYRGNKKTMKICIEKYGPVIKARYENSR